MRAFVAMTVIGAAALLAACGNNASSSSSSAPAAADTSSAAPAAAAPTPEETKKILASLPAPYATADIENGQAKFAVCSSCHTVDAGGSDMTGPNLHGVFNRKGGTKPGYSYSDAMKAAAPAWDAPTIDKWIENPRAMIAGTKMSYIGMHDPKDRADLVAYLAVATGYQPK